MANIRTGSIVSEIRGKVSSEIYSRNRGGAYVKAYAIPTNPASSRQSANRTSFALATSTWTNLSEIEKIRWEQSASSFIRPDRLGRMRATTGRSLFIGRFLNSRSFDDADVEYPEQPNNLENLQVTITATSSQELFAVSNFPVSNYDWGISVYLSLPVSSAVRSPNSTSIRKILNSYYDNNPTFNYKSIYESLWGATTFSSGNFLWVKVVSCHIPSGFVYDTMYEKIEIS